MKKKCRIDSERFGLIDGQDVYLFKLTNICGTCVEIISYGAIIKSIIVPGATGQGENIILGYDSLEEYLADKNYLGATIGRCANRISNASFKIDGETYFLDKNDGLNCNHGGYSGFNTKLFDYWFEDEKLILVAHSPEGEGGFPGNVKLRVTYQLTDKNELLIDYHVATDRKTPINITNHAYFNLSGESTILNHLLKIESDLILETDGDFLPTGSNIEIKKNTALDFSEFRIIGENMALKKEKKSGYNTYFISNNYEKKLKKLATLKSNATETYLEVLSTMPGIMLYTGDYLSGSYTPFSGVSLEAHYYPDFPNWRNFPQAGYAQNDNWNETIVYKFCISN